MCKGTIYIHLCFLITAISTLDAYAQTPGSKINFNAIDDYITAKMQAPRIPGIALAIVKDNQIIYLKGYGKANNRNLKLMQQHYIEGRYKGGAWKVVIPILIILFILIAALTWCSYKAFIWLIHSL